MSLRVRSLVPVLLLACASCASPPTESESVAARLLDDGVAEEERVALAREHAGEAPSVLTELSDGMSPDDEYRRIPWMWRISHAAGEAGDDAVLRDVLDVSLPRDDQPLRDWQAVVVGGGVVGGLSAAGEWPRERIDQILDGHSELAARFDRAVELSHEMADDPDVPDPTRYDALRLIAMDDWASASPRLTHYVADRSEEELQMGAVSGLSDMRAPAADSVLISHFADLTRYNRGLAVMALLQTESRASALLDAVEMGAISPDSLGENWADSLRNTPSAEIRDRAKTLLPPE